MLQMYLTMKILVVVIVYLAQLARAECGNEQFEVLVEEEGSLGLRLADKLVISAFVPSEVGKLREIERSGIVRVGDRILSVNGIDLTLKSVRQAVETLSQEPLPKRITFEAHDDRCIEKITSKKIKQVELVPGINGTGYLFMANAKHSESYLAVEAMFGTTPTCNLKYKVDHAEPALACSPISNHVGGKVVLVKSTAGCPLYEKAYHVQRAGGAGIVVAVDKSKRLFRAMASSKLAAKIHIPLMVISHPASINLEAFFRGGIHTKRSIPRISFAFTLDCLSKQQGIDASHVETTIDTHRQLQTLKSGFLQVHREDEVQSFEFVRSNLGGEFHPFIKPPTLKALALDICDPTSLRNKRISFKDSIVLAPISDCDIETQAMWLENMQATAVIFSNTSSHAISIVERGALHVKIPIIMVSNRSFYLLRSFAEKETYTIDVEPEDDLLHRWIDLARLQDPEKWPTSESARRRLYHRLLTSQQHEHETSTTERHACLQSTFEAAQVFHQV